MNLLLVVHIGGALAVATAVGYSLYSLSKPAFTLHKQLFSALGIGSIVQTLTGSFLAITGDGSVASYCAKIGIYLSAIFITEFLLVKKMQQNASHSFVPVFTYATINSAMVFATVLFLR